MSTEESDKEPSVKEGDNWTRTYIIVLAFLVIQIIVYAFITDSFS